MSERFSIGEVAIIVNCRNYPGVNGMEVEIVGRPFSDGTFILYPIKTAGLPKVDSAAVDCLRKKPKRRECDTLTTWDDVYHISHWRPNVKEAVL
jgi:hypothetical protein